MKAIVTVVGKDHIGIIAKVSTALSEMKVNILDISQTVLSGYFTMMMMVDISDSDLPFDQIVEKMKNVGVGMQNEIHIQRTEIFDAMHHI